MNGSFFSLNDFKIKNETKFSLTKILLKISGGREALNWPFQNSVAKRVLLKCNLTRSFKVQRSD
jgi:hypothetical protein